jgi:NADPH:quinone reductase-like Zn-dependent oxidoreductase
MKAVRFHEFGDPEVLRYEDVDRPRPAAAQVLIRVAATSFNPVDAAIRSGFLQQVFPVALPHTPGIDVAGTLAEIGEGVAGWSVGEAVVGFLPMTEDGASAEFVLAPAELLTGAPTSIPLVDAAALPSASLSAWQALFEQADLKAGQRVLVNGAGGGVGGYALQLAKQAGATVIATASPRSRDAVEALGADWIVDYTATAVTEAISEPVEVVLNLVNAPESDLAGLTDLVSDGGVLVSTTSPVRDDPGRDVRSVRLFVRSDAGQLATIVERVDSGELKVDVSERFPLSEIARVHELGEAGKFRGKVILTPDA